MKLQYTKPTMTVVSFDVPDVIMASSGTPSFSMLEINLFGVGSIRDGVAFAEEHLGPKDIAEFIYDHFG